MNDLNQDLFKYFQQISEDEPVLILEPQVFPNNQDTNNPLIVELRELERTTTNCTLCELSESRRNVVFGAGDPQARMLLIGEAPGVEEDKQGLPFVGRAGQLLNRILNAMGYNREEVYIANILKCRPPENRDPLPHEVEACLPYLKRQIQLIQPDVIVSLGKVSATNLMGLPQSTAVKSLRGRIFSFEGKPLVVTYHPAALLRSQSYKRPTWEDMQVVMKLLSGEIDWQPEDEPTFF